MAGKKGRSGKRKSTPTLVAEALELNESKLPDYLNVLQELVGNPSATVKERMDCIFYLINRSQGSPRQSIDQRSLVATIAFTPDDYALIGQQSEREKTFLKDYTPQLLTEPKKKENDATKQEEGQGKEADSQVGKGN